MMRACAHMFQSRTPYPPVLEIASLCALDYHYHGRIARMRCDPAISGREMLMRTRRHPSSIALALAPLIALVFGALNPVAAQQPAPTATLSPVTAAPTAASPTPTAAPLAPTMAPPTVIATPGPLPTPTPTIVDLFIELIFGKDRAAILSELWQRLWWMAVLAGVLVVAIPFVWKPAGEWIQESIKALLKRAQDKQQAREDKRKRQEELQQSTKVYLDGLRKELELTEVIPIPNAYAAIATRDYVPLQVARPGSTVGEAVFAALGADQSPHGLLLVGAAGSGKSHTLRYTALRLAEAWPRLPGDVAATLGLQTGASLLPVYVRLQDLPRCQQKLREQHKKEPALLQTIDYHLHCRLAGEGMSIVEDFISAHVSAKNERCLFLFDGLDEIDDTHQRHTVQGQIVRLLRDEPGHVYVVTARPLADQTLVGSGFTQRQLLPLQPDQMQRILFYWYRAECGATPTAEDEIRANQAATGLLRMLQSDADLEPMAANPLFLTAMARMATTGVRLPAARVQKYDRLIDLLLEWRRNRMSKADTDNLFPVDHRVALDELSRFAACMLLTGRTDLSIEAYSEGPCVAQLPKRAEGTTAPGADNLERLFRSIVRHTGLLHEEADRYRFSFTFRDYLAACFLARWPDGTQPDVTQRFLNHYHEPGWRTPIVLSTGYWAHKLLSFEPPKKLIAALLDRDRDPEAHLLAAEALGEAVSAGIVPDLERLRRRTVEQLHILKDQPQYTERAHRLLQRLELPNRGMYEP